LSALETNNNPSDRFLQAVGGLTLSWGMIETWLDLSNAILSHDFDGRSIEPEIQRSLERKLKFIKRALAHPSLVLIRERGVRLMDALLVERFQRHRIVHGALGSKGTPDEVEFLQIEYTSHFHKTSTIRVTTEEAIAAAQSASIRSGQIAAFSIALWNTAKPHNPLHHPASKVAW
jgi:hypothetical protein